jgi:hypothetical protein
MQNDDSLSSHGRVNLTWEEMNAGLGVFKMHVSLSYPVFKNSTEVGKPTSPISLIFEKNQQNSEKIARNAPEIMEEQ